MADNSKAVNAVFDIAVMDDDSFGAYSKTQALMTRMERQYL